MKVLPLTSFLCLPCKVLEIGQATACSFVGQERFNKLLIPILRLGSELSSEFKVFVAKPLEVLCNFKQGYQAIGIFFNAEALWTRPSFITVTKCWISVVAIARFFFNVEKDTLKNLALSSQSLGSVQTLSFWETGKGFLKAHGGAMCILTGSAVGIVVILAKCYRAKTEEERTKACSTDCMLLLATHVARMGVCVLGYYQLTAIALSIDALGKLANYSRFIIACQRTI